MLLGKMVETSHGVAEGAGIANMLPGQSGEAGCELGISSCHTLSVPEEDSLQSGVMGVFTGLTRTLSR